MFAKLLTLILCLGLMAGLLLVNRQRLYEVVGERVRLHRETERLERSVQELRVRVAEATMPTQIDGLIGDERNRWGTIGDREQLTSPFGTGLMTGAADRK